MAAFILAKYLLCKINESSLCVYPLTDVPSVIHISNHRSNNQDNTIVCERETERDRGEGNRICQLMIVENKRSVVL